MKLECAFLQHYKIPQIHKVVLNFLSYKFSQKYVPVFCKVVIVI
jgi:hypothetical protein